jgi:predicted amidohydrolase
MARHIKISALGFNNLIENDSKRSLEQYVNDVTEYIDMQIDKVIYDKPDYIILPECCDRIIQPLENRHKNSNRIYDYYKLRGDKIKNHLAQRAKAYGFGIAYSACRVMFDGTMRNSIQFINNKGEIDGIYDKNHVMIEEYDSGILYGEKAEVINTAAGKVAGVICFDLNFDDLRQNYINQRPELLVFSSAFHGGLMQNYWAYSCRSYFVGAVTNSVCTIISPVGNIIASSTNYTDFVTATINLDYEVVHLDGNREYKLKSAKQKYGGKLKIYDPGYLGSVLLTSECDSISVKDIVKEFDIEILNDYLYRCNKHRNINIKTR